MTRAGALLLAAGLASHLAGLTMLLYGLDAGSEDHLRRGALVTPLATLLCILGALALLRRRAQPGIQVIAPALPVWRPVLPQRPFYPSQRRSAPPI